MYERIKKEVSRLILCHELNVPKDTTVKFNDTTHLLDEDRVSLGTSNQNADLAFAIGQSAFKDYQYGKSILPV